MAADDVQRRAFAVLADLDSAAIRAEVDLITAQATGEGRDSILALRLGLFEAATVASTAWHLRVDSERLEAQGCVLAADKVRRSLIQLGSETNQQEESNDG